MCVRVVTWQLFKRGSTGQKSQKKLKKIFLHFHCSNIIRIQCIKLNVFMMHTDTNIVS